MSDHHQPRHDPLLECLAILARRFQRPVSLESLVAGLPVRPGDSSPELFSIDRSKALLSRVAKRAGFVTRLIQRDLDDFTDLLLPCILVLKGRNACILESIDHEAGTAMVILPEVSDGATEFKLDVLSEQQMGFAFLVKPEFQGTPDHRRVIGLRQFEGLSAAEVGQRLGRSESAVHSLYRRGLEAWEQELPRGLDMNDTGPLPAN